jgi:integrase
LSRTVKRAFAWAWNKGLIEHHPLRSVSYPNGPRGEAMTEQQFRHLLRGSAALMRRVLLFLWWTGCRPGELCKLQWKFIDVEKGIAILRVHKTARSRKDRAPRIIVLPEKAIRLLCWLLSNQRENEAYVFLNSLGNPWNRNSLGLRVFRLKKSGRVPMGVKMVGTRHSFGTRLAVAGVDLKTLSTLMGHTTTIMSEHYIHMANQTDHLRDALEKLSRKKNRGAS